VGQGAQKDRRGGRIIGGIGGMGSVRPLQRSDDPYEPYAFSDPTPNALWGSMRGVGFKSLALSGHQSQATDRKVGRKCAADGDHANAFKTARVEPNIGAMRCKVFE